MLGFLKEFLKTKSECLTILHFRFIGKKRKRRKKKLAGCKFSEFNEEHHVLCAQEECKVNTDLKKKKKT